MKREMHSRDANRENVTYAAATNREKNIAAQTENGGTIVCIKIAVNRPHTRQAFPSLSPCQNSGEKHDTSWI
jgi:hypothetical protein